LGSSCFAGKLREPSILVEIFADLNYDYIYDLNIKNNEISVTVIFYMSILHIFQTKSHKVFKGIKKDFTPYL
jgi:hypothetical protein